MPGREAPMVRLLSTLEQPVKASPQSSSPIVVGGIGGSGTRVVVNLPQAAGVVTGSRLNGSLDLLDFVPLLDAHVERLALARPLAEGGRVAAIESWHARLVASPGIGRWRTAAPSLQESIFQGCAEGLAQFGYLASGGTNRQPAANGSCAVGPGKGMP